jgi:hypothetical protein
MPPEVILPAECTLCPNTVCADLTTGRIKNTNGDVRPLDTAKIEILTKPIKECPTFLTANTQPSEKA